MGILADAADVIDPDRQVERHELRDPVSLAAHLDSYYQVRAHLQVIAEEMVGLEAGRVDRLLINTPPQVGKWVDLLERQEMDRAVQVLRDASLGPAL